MRKLLMIPALALFLAGCTQSNILTPNQPKAESTEAAFVTDDGIDWIDANSAAEETFEPPCDYEYGRDFKLFIEPNQKAVRLIWVVDDNLPDEKILPYSEALLKGFNDIIADQTGEIAYSDENSFGGLWKEYSLSFAIVPESTQEQEDTWFIDAEYDAGTDFKLPEFEPGE